MRTFEPNLPKHNDARNLSDWPTVRLGDVADARLGKMLDAQKNRGKPLPYIRNPNVKWFDVDLADLKEMPFEGDEEEKYAIKDGDVLICEGGEAGRAAIWRGPDIGVKFQKAIHRVRPKPMLHNRFLVHRLFYDYHAGQLNDYYTGTTIKHLTGQDLARYELALPPLDEQRRIAAILDQADDLRRKRREALAFVNLLSTAYFRELFGELSQSPPIFEVVRFDEVIEKGPTNGIYKPAEAYGDGTKILRINNFYNGYISDISALRRLSLTPNEIQLFNLAEDDIVINRVNSREFLGKSALIPKLDEPIVFESNMMRISLKKNLIDPVFCIHVLQTKHIGNQILMSAKDAVNQSSINQKDVRGFQFPLPPLPLQRAFAARVAEIDKLKAHHRAHLARLDALFASLQHRAFRGDLSVPKSETSPCDSFSHGEKVAPP